MEGDDWDGAYLSFVNGSGIEIGQYTNTATKTYRNVTLPMGHVEMHWNVASQNIEYMRFELKDDQGQSVVSFEGASSELQKGLIFFINNTCGFEANLYVPTNLVAIRDNNDVQLQWDAVEGDVNRYCVYRDGVLHAVSETCNYTDAGAFDAFHTYFVTTLTDEGESDASNMCNIQPEGGCEAPSGLRYEMVNNKAKLSWDVPQGGAPTGYYVFRRTRGKEFKRIKAVANTTYSDNINNQPDGVYEYAVVAYYQADDCTSAYATTNDNPEKYFLSVNKTIIPMGLVGEVTGNNVVLNWEPALMAETYKVYRNGELISQGLTEPTFTDENISMQEMFIYTVTGNTTFLESNYSNAVVVNYGATVLESADGVEVSLYPNPTSAQISVEAEGINQVVVLNLMGQEVMRQPASTNKITLDMSNLPDGTYFIKVVTETGSITNKVLKIK